MARSTALVALLAIAASTASAFVLPSAPKPASTVMQASRDGGLQDRRAQLERVALAGLGFVMAPAMPAFADRYVRELSSFLFVVCHVGVLELSQ